HPPRDVGEPVQEHPRPRDPPGELGPALAAARPVEHRGAAEEREQRVDERHGVRGGSFPAGPPEGDAHGRGEDPDASGGPDRRQPLLPGRQSPGSVGRGVGRGGRGVVVVHEGRRVAGRFAPMADRPRPGDPERSPRCPRRRPEHGRAPPRADLTGRQDCGRLATSPGQEGALVDLTWSESEEAFREEARSWLEDNVPRPALPSGDTREGFAAHLEWERRLHEARWSVVSWPEEYGGRGASLWE